MKESLKSISGYILEKFQTKFSVSLDFSGSKYKIITNNSSVQNMLLNYFDNFLDYEVEFSEKIHVIHDPEFTTNFSFTDNLPDKGKTKIKEEYYLLSDGICVRKKSTGMLFFFGKGINIAAGDCLNNINQVVNFVNNRHIGRKLDEGCLLFHASAVSSNNRGLAISGFPGKGKSTLALRLLSAGMTFITNDRLMINKIDGSAKMFGVAKYPRINPGTIINNRDLIKLLSEKERNFFLSMKTSDIWSYEKKYDAIIEKYFGYGRFKLEENFNALVILNWNLNYYKKTLVNKIDLSEHPELFESFVKSPGLFYRSEGDSIENKFSYDRYRELLEGYDVFELKGKVDFNWAAEYFNQYLK
ncbi:HprK-related kinase B [candidate division WOR-3 bacterium]|nr:HprK-related kinase B [candidate division WOR-3 bacterium]